MDAGSPFGNSGQDRPGNVLSAGEIELLLAAKVIGNSSDVDTCEPGYVARSCSLEPFAHELDNPSLNEFAAALGRRSILGLWHSGIISINRLISKTKANPCCA